MQRTTWTKEHSRAGMHFYALLFLDETQDPKIWDAVIICSGWVDDDPEKMHIDYYDYSIQPASTLNLIVNEFGYCETNAFWFERINTQVQQHMMWSALKD